MYHAEGRVAFYPGNPSATPPVEDERYYEFSMRDHLGNTRISFADLNDDGHIQANPGDWIFNDPHGSPTGYTEILQENHYYRYNHLNLPRQVEAQGYNDYGSGAIRFTYDATGRKLKKSTSGNNGGTTLLAQGLSVIDGHI